MKRINKKGWWVGFVSVLLILSLIFSAVGCGEEEETKEPTVAGAYPSSGEVGETISVNILGTNLTGASAVTFGAGITVDSLNVVSLYHISASITIAPAATPNRCLLMNFRTRYLVLGGPATTGSCLR